MKKIIPLLLLCSCFSSHTNPEKLVSINIIDRNGLSETISKKERLGFYQNTDFLAPQPYQKVLRVFGRNKEGDIHSHITSYHPNGEVKQSLEAVNNRAFGQYLEWYPNGQVKIESRVIGGIADINTQAEESWLFDGITHAWDEEGHKIAEIPYSKGALVNEAKYFHTTGQLWKIAPYEKNVLHGEEKIYLADGTLFQTTNYNNGLKEGVSSRFWEKEKRAFLENYSQGLLMEAEYRNIEGELLSTIHEGKGFRAILGKKGVIELQEYLNGKQEGIVKIFDEKNGLVRSFFIKEGEKEGEEIEYFYNSTNPKLLMTWSKGILQGPVKTWYENGHLESLKEMGQNKKNGLCSAWYDSGLLMLVEEYENDRLLKGEYYKSGEKVPLSKIEKGKGIATLFDSRGNFIRKVSYLDGSPIN